MCRGVSVDAYLRPRRLGDRGMHEPSLCKARTMHAPLALDAALMLKQKLLRQVYTF